MRKDNDRLKNLQSMNVTFHREVTSKLDEDLPSMTAVQNELQQRLRVSKFQQSLDREEFDKLLQVVNQCKVAVHNNEEDDSFSH